MAAVLAGLPLLHGDRKGVNIYTATPEQPVRSNLLIQREYVS